ncbi:MAG: DUF3842 family protein [Clostridiales bacterium]|nr:DUF3842 family protein [Clostridiales bacterium]
MKILVIDGQGGKMGKTIIEQLKITIPKCDIIALGTNSIATSAMLKAGADHAATGENPVVFNCTDADIIVGSMGIIVANSYMGEITPAMANAVSKSKAAKVLIPINRCNMFVAGIEELPFGEYTRLAAQKVKEIIENQSKD